MYTNDTNIDDKVYRISIPLKVVREGFWWKCMLAKKVYVCETLSPICSSYSAVMSMKSILMNKYVDEYVCWYIYLFVFANILVVQFDQHSQNSSPTYFLKKSSCQGAFWVQNLTQKESFGSRTLKNCLLQGSLQEI